MHALLIATDFRSECERDQAQIGATALETGIDAAGHRRIVHC
jgi:hypothetical protein